MNRPERYLKGHFRAEYRGEQQPESMRVGGSDYALEITRGAELTMAAPTAAYSVAGLTDEQTFSASVVSSVRVSHSDTHAAPPRLTTLLNVVVKNVHLRDVVYHGSTVYGVLEGEAYATVGGIDAGSAAFPSEPFVPAPARGLWRLGCLLPLLTLSMGGCLVSRGLWSGAGNSWLTSGSGTSLTEEFMPDLDLDLDLPDIDSLTSKSPNKGEKIVRQGQAPSEEIPVTGPYLSVALSDWNRADGDQVQLLLNDVPIGSSFLLKQQPQSVLLRQLQADSVNLLTIDTRSQGSMGVASVRVELNDGTNPSRHYDLRGRLGHPLTLRLRLLPSGTSSSSIPNQAATDTAVVDSTSTAIYRP